MTVKEEKRGARKTQTFLILMVMLRKLRKLKRQLAVTIRPKGGSRITGRGQFDDYSFRL